MYAFKNQVYLILGMVFIIFGAILMAGPGAIVGILLVILGIAMSTFAAYQIGQSSPVSKP